MTLADKEVITSVICSLGLIENEVGDTLGFKLAVLALGELLEKPIEQEKL